MAGGGINLAVQGDSDRLTSVLFFLSLNIRNRNTAARQHNSVVVTLSDIALEPLYSLLTGEEIPGFPATINEIETLNRMTQPPLTDDIHPG